MNAPFNALSRRQLLQSLGALVVIVPAALKAGEALAQTAGRPPLKPTELDSWIAIGKDGRITAFLGKPDVGQGVDVAIAQIVGEELDVPVDHVEVVCGDTARTLNQGGVSGSTAVQLGAVPLRNAAAEARRLLVEKAAQKFGVTPDQLKVDAGVISQIGKPSAHISYAELIGGDYFRAQLEWNGQVGNTMVATGKAKPKTVDQYRLVGQSPQRRDIPGKIYGDHQYIADFRRPNMLYGRMIRPPVAGARPVSVDEASIADIAGAKVVRRDDLIGVVAESEWDVVKASRALKVSWSAAAPALTPYGDIHDHIRKAPVAKRSIDKPVGDTLTAFAHIDAKMIEAEYLWPYQSHSSLAPACALAEVGPDLVTAWHSSQKPHATAEGIAKLLGRPIEQVRSVFVDGPGSYGRNDAGDACGDAALMAQITGRPVRVQGARSDGHGWDPKGPASVHKVRAALGPDGKLSGYEFMSKGFSRTEVAITEADPKDMLAGQLIGFKNTPQPNFATPEEAYQFPNRTMGWETIDAFMANGSPLRTSHLRDPLGPQIHFASESFIDECAFAAKADPIAFRLKHLTNPRDIAALKAAAEKAGWKAGPHGTRRTTRDGLMIGSGVAYSRRGATIVATVVEVEVDPATGRVWPRRFVVAHDCGLVVNPGTLHNVIEGNVIHSTSRALLEEVTFNDKMVTSIDWLTYPILDIMDAPETVDVILMHQPNEPPSGAGEPSSRPTAAAIANAIFEATGVRLRQAPFTKARVKAALRA